MSFWFEKHTNVYDWIERGLEGVTGLKPSLEELNNVLKEYDRLFRDEFLEPSRTLSQFAVNNADYFLHTANRLTNTIDIISNYTIHTFEVGPPQWGNDLIHDFNQTLTGTLTNVTNFLGYIEKTLTDVTNLATQAGGGVIIQINNQFRAITSAIKDSSEIQLTRQRELIEALGDRTCGAGTPQTRPSSVPSVEVPVIMQQSFDPNTVTVEELTSYPLSAVASVMGISTASLESLLEPFNGSIEDAVEVFGGDVPSFFEAATSLSPDVSGEQPRTATTPRTQPATSTTKTSSSESSETPSPGVSSLSGVDLSAFSSIPPETLVNMPLSTIAGFLGTEESVLEELLEPFGGDLQAALDVFDGDVELALLTLKNLIELRKRHFPHVRRYIVRPSPVSRRREWRPLEHRGAMIRWQRAH